MLYVFYYDFSFIRENWTMDLRGVFILLVTTLCIAAHHMGYRDFDSPDTPDRFYDAPDSPDTNDYYYPQPTYTRPVRTFYRPIRRRRPTFIRRRYIFGWTRHRSTIYLFRLKSWKYFLWVNIVRMTIRV